MENKGYLCSKGLKDQHLLVLIKILKVRESIPDINYSVLVGQTYKTVSVRLHKLPYTKLVQFYSSSRGSFLSAPVKEGNAVEERLHADSIPVEIEDEGNYRVAKPVGEIDVCKESENVHSERHNQTWGQASQSA